MRKNIKVKDEYITSDANVAGMHGNHCHVSRVFDDNTDIYRIARVFVGSPKDNWHNTVQFLVFKNGMRNCGLEWNSISGIDMRALQKENRNNEENYDPMNGDSFLACCAFDTPEKAEEFLQYWLKKQDEVEKRLLEHLNKNPDNKVIKELAEIGAIDQWDRASFQAGRFADCKYMIVRLVNSLDVCKEFPGLVYNKDTNTAEMIDSVFVIASNLRDEDGHEI